MPKRLHFFGSWFLSFDSTSSMFLLYFLRKKRVRNNLAPPSHCASGKNHGYLFLWNLFDFKSRNSTRGDYYIKITFKRDLFQSQIKYFTERNIFWHGWTWYSNIYHCRRLGNLDWRCPHPNFKLNFKNNLYFYTLYYATLVQILLLSVLKWFKHFCLFKIYFQDCLS